MPAAELIERKLAGVGRRVAVAASWPQKALFAWGLRSTAGLSLPDFLVIGAQKAGTTWLYENLRQHPDLFLPDEKELHYFDWHFERSVADYAAHFVDGAGKVKGEVTPGYSILPVGRIRFLRRIMPAVRLVLLIRNPVERAWSHAYKNLVTIPNRRLADVPAVEFREHFLSDGSRSRGDYLTILGRWLSIFPREQFYLGLYDDIATQPQQLMTAVFEHLGVTVNVDWTAFPLEHVILPQYADDTVKSGYRANGYERSDALMPSEHREFLMQLYDEDIRQLSARYQLPVEGWLKEASDAGS